MKIVVPHHLHVCNLVSICSKFQFTKQTKCTKDTELFQQPSMTTPESMANFRAAQKIQKDMWKSYDDFIELQEKKQPDGKSQVRQNLKKCTELPEKLNRNFRSHPDIVNKCSIAFYKCDMKPATEKK